MSTLSIEEQVTQNYNDNIHYFKEHQVRLFEKLSSFESALENGHYTPKYELEYKEEGYFDVKELSSGNYLYGQNSADYAQRSTENINFNKKDDLFETFYHFSFTDEEIAHYESSKDISSNGAYGIAPIIHYTNGATNKDMDLKRIEKFIFFGVGLGTHLKEIDKKISASTYLVVEDDLELFRLSLFTQSYQQLAKKSTLFFSIFEEDEDAKITFGEFLEKNFFHNHYLKFFQMLSFQDKKIKVMHSIVASLDYMVYPFHAYFSQYLRSLEYMKKHYNFLNVSGNVIGDIFSSKPVLLIAAGPSLMKNIGWLKQNQERFILVALTATLNILEKEGISPDIVTHLDPFEHGSMPHIEKLKSMDFLKNTLCIFGGKSPLALTNKFVKRNVFMFEDSSNYLKDFGTLSASCVGSTTYALLLSLGATEIHLLGLDLALDEKTGNTHSTAHAHNASKDLSKAEELEEVFAYKDSVIKVKGNFKDEVYTTAPFYNSIIGVNQSTYLYKKMHQNVYNHNDGAYYHDVEPIKLEDFKVKELLKIDKVSMHKILHQNLENNAVHTFDDDKIIIPIKTRLKHVKTVQKILKNYKKRTRYTTIEVYQQDLSMMVVDLLKIRSAESLELVVIYFKYFQYVLPYIYDMLNTKGLQNPKIHIKEVDKLLLVKLVEIVIYYENVLESFLEKELVH